MSKSFCIRHLIQFSMVLFSLVAFNLSAQASSDKMPINSTWLSVSGQANLDYFANRSKDYSTNLRTQNTQITLVANLATNVKAVIVAEIERMLIENGHDPKNEKLDIERIIHEAYVEIRMDKTLGKPVVLIIGKGHMAFGALASRLPMHHDHLLYDVARMESVIGITMVLDKRALGILDAFEVSVFENSLEDLQIGSGGGLSVRLTKKLNNRMKLIGSGMIMESPNSSKTEKRASIGLVYHDKHRGWRAYAEGVALSGYRGTGRHSHNHGGHHHGSTPASEEHSEEEEHPEEHEGEEHEEESSEEEHADEHGHAREKEPTPGFGFNAGVAIEAGPGEVIIDYAYLEEVAHELALAYSLPLKYGITVSPEVRKTWGEGSQEDDFRVGVRVGIRFRSGSGRSQGHDHGGGHDHDHGGPGQDFEEIEDDLGDAP